ncbi:MAG: uncharacterized protein QOC93_2205 [Actinomycetota bacterium]|nr:uncharacterized protein [Actinomycetota bacterium]
MSPIPTALPVHGPPAPVRRPLHPALRWSALGLGGYLAGLVAALLGVPAPFLLASLLLGVAYAVTARSAPAFPRPAYRLSQALIGVVMGSYLAPASMRQVAPEILPLLLVTAGTVVVSLGGAYLLARTGLVNHRTATLGMAPGGSAAIVATADELAADTRLVAFTQYLRVAVVAVSAPLAVWLSHGGPGTPPAAGPDLHLAPQSPAGVLALLALVLLGPRLGGRLHLPAPALLGPMLLAAAVTCTGLVHGVVPDGILRDLTFTAVGLEVGLRFTRASLVHVRRLFWPVLTATVAVSVACAGLAWGLAVARHIPLLDAYLATTPGGINAVLATAVTSHADVPLISSVQSLRLFAVVLATPPLLRLATRILARDG